QTCRRAPFAPSPNRVQAQLKPQIRPRTGKFANSSEVSFFLGDSYCSQVTRSAQPALEGVVRGQPEAHSPLWRALCAANPKRTARIGALCAANPKPTARMGALCATNQKWGYF